MEIIIFGFILIGIGLRAFEAILPVLGIVFLILLPAGAVFIVAFKSKEVKDTILGLSIGIAILAFTPITAWLLVNACVGDNLVEKIIAVIAIDCVVCVSIGGGPYLIFLFCCYLNKQIHKTADKYRTKKEIRQKSRVIAEGNRYLQQDLKEYAKLVKMNTVPISDIELSSRFVDLLEKADVDSAQISKFKSAINERRNLCLRQQELKKKILKLAEQYDEVGNTTAAEKLRQQLSEIA